MRGDECTWKSYGGVSRLPPSGRQRPFLEAARQHASNGRAVGWEPARTAPMRLGKLRSCTHDVVLVGHYTRAGSGFDLARCLAEGLARGAIIMI